MMTETQYDPDGTVEVEVRVLLDLLDRVLYEAVTNGEVDYYRAKDLKRRVEGGQVYVGVNDWPVKEVR
jgi:hypothetical protein